MRNKIIEAILIFIFLCFFAYFSKLFIVNDIPNINDTLAVSSKINKKELFLSAFDSFKQVKYFYKKGLFYEIYPNFEVILNRLKFDHLKYGYTFNIFKDTKTNTLEHTFKTIEAIDFLSIPPEIDKKKLRLIMFFHDFGKWIAKENHESNSAIMTKNILTDIGFEEKEIKFICKIIKYHGELGRYAHSRLDLKLLTNKELDYLYWVTLCDVYERRPFNHKNNLLKLELVYKHLKGEKIEESFLELKLNLIDKLVEINKFLWEKDIDLFFVFKNFLMGYSFKIIPNIMYSV